MICVKKKSVETLFFVYGDSEQKRIEYQKVGKKLLIFK